jgi:hypothetical protein
MGVRAMSKPSDLARFLPEPAIESIPDAVAPAHYIRLQGKDRRAVRTLQPDPGTQVYLFLDADDLPVGIKVLLPAEDLDLLRVVREGLRHRAMADPAVLALVIAGLEKYGREAREPACPAPRGHDAAAP